jgi:ferritin
MRTGPGAFTTDQAEEPPSRLNQMRKFMRKYREATEIEFAENPVLERTMPREILEIIEAAKQRRRGRASG